MYYVCSLGFSKYYNKELLDIVNELYYEDFKIFDYEMI